MEELLLGVSVSRDELEICNSSIHGTNGYLTRSFLKPISERALLIGNAWNYEGISARYIVGTHDLLPWSIMNNLKHTCQALQIACHANDHSNTRRAFPIDSARFLPKCLSNLQKP